MPENPAFFLNWKVMTHFPKLNLLTNQNLTDKKTYCFRLQKYDITIW